MGDRRAIASAPVRPVSAAYVLICAKFSLQKSSNRIFQLILMMLNLDFEEYCTARVYGYNVIIVGIDPCLGSCVPAISSCEDVHVTVDDVFSNSSEIIPTDCGGQ